MPKAAKDEKVPQEATGSSLVADDEALGRGLPADWTIEALRERAQALLDGYLKAADSAAAVKSFKEFAAEIPGVFDEVVVCALRTALDRTGKQRKSVTELLALLHKEGVLDRPSLARGYAKMICTWQELAAEGGSESSAHLVDMLLACIRSGCIAEEFLMRLPEGFLVAVLGNDIEGKKELEKVKERLHQFKRVIEDAKLLEPPLPGLEKASSVLKDQAQQCRHEFVKRSLSASLEWPPAGRRRCLALVEKLMEKGVLSKEDVQWGVIHLLGQLEDLTLDCPNVQEITAENVKSLISKDLISTNFVRRCQMLRIGGDAGTKVLGAALDPNSEALPVTKNSKVAQAIEASRQGEETSKDTKSDKKEDSSKEESAVSKKASNPEKEEAKSEAKEDAKDKEGSTESSKEAASNEEAKKDGKEEPKQDSAQDAKAAAVNGTAPKAGGRLSGCGISLRPGGGMALRPGGGGISLTGGLNGQTLRPGGGGAVSLTGVVKESSGTAGYPKEEGRRSSVTAEKKESDWRRDAAEHQDAKQKNQKNDKAGAKKGANGKSGGKGRNNRDDDDDMDSEPLQLEVSENSWAKIQQKRREEAEGAKTGGPDSSDEEIARRMKSILNKLTLEKFDELYKQLTECGITKEDHIRILMTEVFEKATTQHHFVEMYTSLCVHFNDWCSEHLKVGKFKHVLLDQCQASFEANLSDPPKEMSPKKKAAATPEELEEHEEKRQRYRLRVMGNIRFIGQLLVKKMVASKILTACTNALLKEASPSSLEALASLLTIAGKEFDTTTWQHHDALEKTFKKMEKLTKDKSLDCRTRFLLQDVLDLRSSGWMDNKVATKKLEAPRKLGDFGDGKKEAK